MRIKITFAYNGKDFLGSQAQTQTPNTVNGTLESIFEKIGIDAKLTASGRTDKGVHASKQVVHLDIPPYWDNLNKLKQTLNTLAPNSIVIKKIEPVSQIFHARYDAKKRVYRYIIKDAPSNPFEADFISFYRGVDFQKLQQNITLFQGEHNFSGFMKTGSDIASTTREIYKTMAYKHKAYIVLYFEANGFLRSQIRLMVGALLSLDAKEIKEQLTLQKQHKFKPAKPNGLYLAKIKY